MDTTSYPASRSRWCQDGTLPSYGAALSQYPVRWTYCPVARLARDGTQMGELQ